MKACSISLIDSTCAFANCATGLCHKVIHGLAEVAIGVLRNKVKMITHKYEACDSDVEGMVKKEEVVTHDRPYFFNRYIEPIFI